MKNWIDLHMHSTYSADGTYSPKELIHLCKEARLKVVALTDHNSIFGVSEMIEYGKEHQIEVIPGVELDCQFKGKFLHILCYGINPKDERVIQHEARVRKAELSSSEQLMKNVKKLGICFDEEKVMALSRDGTICGEMIAEIALEDPRNEGNITLEPYREGGERSKNPLVNFYWDYCAPGREAYAYIDYPQLKELIKLIRSVGGFAVLAHPGANVGRDVDYIREVKNMGIAGMEVYSSYHSKEDIQYFTEVAKELSLVVTIGSDFHGKTKPAVQMANFEIENQTAIIEEFLQSVKAVKVKSSKE